MATAPRRKFESQLLDPPKFGLRALFWATTVLALVFGVMALLGTGAAVAFLLLVIMIALHVAGGALGTQLRESAPCLPDAPRPIRRSPTAARWQPPPTTALQQRRPAERIILAISLLGGLLGACSGSIGILLYHGPAITPAAVAICALASATLAGLAFFLTTSFIYVLQQSWRQAAHLADAAPPRCPQAPRAGIRCSTPEAKGSN